MTYQGVGQLAIVLRNVNAYVYQEVLEIFLLPSLGEWFGAFTFQDDNASSHRSKKIKHFLKYNGDSPIKTMK